MIGWGRRASPSCWSPGAPRRRRRRRRPVAVKGDMELLVEQGQKDLEGRRDLVSHRGSLRDGPAVSPAARRAAEGHRGEAPRWDMPTTSSATPTTGWASARRRSKPSSRRRSTCPTARCSTTTWAGPTARSAGQGADRRAAAGDRPAAALRHGPASLGLVLLRQGDRKGAEEQYAALLDVRRGGRRRR